MLRLLSVALCGTLISSASLFYLYDSEKTDRIKAESALESAQLTLVVERENYQRQADKLLLLNTDMALVQSRSDMLTNQLNGYRDREKLLQKKPETIERLANAATAGVFNDILRASSGGDNQSKASDSSTDTDD